MVNGTVDCDLAPLDLPDAQFSLLSKPPPGDFGDFVLDLLAGDVILLPSHRPQ